MPNDFFGIKAELAFSKFFDRAEVIKKVDKKNASAMKFIGGFTRKTARNSIKKTTSTTLTSPPGKPVRSRTGIYKRTIFFEYDDRKETVIIGPKRLPRLSKVRSGKTTPQLLEEGGRATAKKDLFRRVRARKVKRRRRRGEAKRKKFVWVKIKRGTQLNYRARPTMKLAQKKSFSSPKLQRAFGVIGFNTRT